MLYFRSPKPRAWQSLMTGTKPDIGEALARSWRRSRSKGADLLDPVKSAMEPFLGASATRERQQANEKTWRHIEPVLDNLSAQLSRGGFVGVWADPDGVILHRRGGGEFLTTAQRLELCEGANWNEATRGTNAIGTAIDERCEVAVLGYAHLQRPNHKLACYAAPVLSPHGDVVGVLDVTSHIESAREMALATVLAARGAIESALKLTAYDEMVRGGLELLYQMIDLCPSPALLIEPDGTLRAVNEKARARFGTNPPIANQLSWEQLMHTRETPMELRLTELDGVVTTWRPIVECVGPLTHPIAALVFLEPRAPRVISTPARSPVQTTAAFARLDGHDPALERTRRRVAKLAPTSLPLLLLAETGTGKEHLARTAHDLSNRADGPFVAINCGALGKDLLESELFGYAPGAFTGAKREGSTGKIDAADGGTLFLDEVAEMSATCQAALLRVLEDGSYYRVGDARPQRADVRVIAATCRDLEESVAQGKMRRDLYYRLKGARLTLPPLRERGDLEALATALLKKLTSPSPPPTISPECLAILRGYTWPGNIRELKNCLHVAWVMSDQTGSLEPHHLPDDILESSSGAAIDPATSLAEAEASALEAALERAGGNLSKTARLLGIARSTLYRMLERHGMR